MTSSSPLFTVQNPHYPAGFPEDLKPLYRPQLIGQMPVADCIECGWGWAFPLNSLDSRKGEARWAGVRDHAAKHAGGGS